MVAKRVLFRDDPAVIKRLRKVEKMAKNNRPEMKHKLFTGSGTVSAASTNPGLSNNIVNALTIGDEVNERIGNKVKIWRVEIRGFTNNDVEVHFIQSPHAQVPVASFFENTAGTMIDDSQIGINFYDWLHIVNTNVASNTDVWFKRQFKFKNGLECQYLTSNTTPSTNLLSLAFLNTTATALDYSYSVRIWYTDG